MSLSDDDFLARMRSTMADDPDDGTVRRAGPRSTAEGSAELDDDPELERLRQLRAVWLALPDAEPPKDGMAALMAAARAKATEMQPRTPWWQSVLATLRRPPVLALATVVVLVGGAVFVGRHHAEVDVETPAIIPSPPAGPAAREPFEAHAPAAGSAEVAPDPVAKNTGAVLPEERRPAKVTQPVTTTKPPAPAHHEPNKKPPAADESTMQIGGEDRSVTPRDDAKRPSDPTSAILSKDSKEQVSEGDSARTVDQNPRGGGGAPGSGIAVTGADAPAPTPPPVAPAPSPKPTSTKPTSTPTSPPIADPAPVSLDSLFQQCQSAAARGDCAAVKLLAARIAKASATVYRDKVKKDAAVVKCLQ